MNGSRGGSNPRSWCYSCGQKTTFFSPWPDHFQSNRPPVKSASKSQRKQTTQHALSIGKLEKEIGILSKDIKSFRIELTELRKQHQEDINRLETHVTENSKDIVDLTNKTKENGISIEQLQTSNLQLSKKIEALDERLNLTQKQKELLRKTINRLEEDILRNTNKIEAK